MPDKELTKDEAIEMAARSAVNEFYIMYPAAKTQLPRTAKQSLEGYIIRHMKEIMI